MKRTIPVLAAIVLLLWTGCTSKDSGGEETADGASAPETSETSGIPQGAGWYYFSDSGIHPAPDPAGIPARDFLPWTEAVRVSDAAIVNNRPSLLINRLGLMTSGSEGEAPALHGDSLFSSRTTAGVYRTETETAIRVYRNSFFSEADASGSGIFLAGYDSASGSFHPAYTAQDLGLDVGSQCVALDRIGSMWYASFKVERENKVDFTYLEFESFPEKNGASYDLSGIRKISSASYQNSVSPFSWNDAPDQLKSLLRSIPETTAFSLKAYSRAGRAAQTYVRKTEGVPVDGTAYVSDDATAVLFADGTFCWCADNSSGKNETFKLPGLSTGYVYTSFIISGETLLAAWEEQRFFETGRAGLLVTSLRDGVY